MSAKYSKYADVNLLLEKCDASLKVIEKLYARCLHDQNVPAILMMEVKDLLGNLRSPLDYLNGRISGSAAYFPICEHQNDFRARYGATSPTTQAALERWQPYNGQSWLRWFNILNNKNKHVTLTPQRRIETRQVQVSHPSGGSVTWGPGVTFGSGVSIMGVPIDPRTQMPMPNNTVSTQVTVWVDFIFDNSGELAAIPANLSVLGFLRDCFDKIAAIVKEVEATIP